MLEQISLLDDLRVNPKCFHKNIQAAGFVYQEINIGDITFKAGQSESVHRWFRLTPSYSPGLVRYLFEELGVSENDFVLDPFSGRGTTAIECQKRRIRSLGIEINPLLQQVADKSLVWSSANLELIDEYINESRELGFELREQSLEAVADTFQTRLPIIHNPFRWWKKEVLKDLIICRELSLKPRYASVLDYLWLAVNRAALDCANIHRNHPTITFDDNHQRRIDVHLEVSENLKIIKQDLKSLSGAELAHSKTSSVILGNSTKSLTDVVKRQVDCVITSPPYPNRYSYVHQTRPQLHFMELLKDVRQATEIDLESIGGTWGRATSILQNKLLDVPDDLLPLLGFYDELKEQSVLMCNYATKYFIELSHHIRALRKVATRNFRAAYVVGNSRLSGIEILPKRFWQRFLSSTTLRSKKSCRSENGVGGRGFMKPRYALKVRQHAVNFSFQRCRVCLQKSVQVEAGERLN